MRRNNMYLTQGLKQKYLNKLKLPDVFIDEEIEQYINIINNIPFTCVTQCCAGHPGNGYLSIMINKEYVEWFEHEVIIALISYCNNVFERFEDITKDEVIARYVFYFKQKFNDKFWLTMIELLKNKSVKE